MAGKGALDLSIRISGQLDKSLMASLDGAQRQVSTFAKSVSAIGKLGLASLSAMAVVGVKGIVDCTDEASKFEAQMADVVKYVGGLADSSGKISNQMSGNGKTYAENYEAMKDAILDLSSEIPYTAEELTRLAAAAGQSGKSFDEIVSLDASGKVQGFLRDVAMWGTAMDISADQAGDWGAKWEKAFNMDHDEIMVLADQINYLGANSATTAAEIAEVVNGAASLGQVGGMTPATVAAMGDAMLAMGVNSHRTTTSLKRMVTQVNMGTSATGAQKEAWEELGLSAEGVASAMQVDSTGTWLDIFERINSIDADKQIAVLKNLFGQWAIEGSAKIVGNTQTFVDALKMVNDPSLYSGSMERELIIKASTSESVDAMVDNAMRAMKIDIGDAFLPVKKEIGLMKLDFIGQIRDNMPDLERLAQKTLPLIKSAVEGIGNGIVGALPYVEKLIDYLTTNGEEAARIAGAVAAAFAGMSFAPQIEWVLGGAGSFLFGEGKQKGTVENGGSGKRKGGIFSRLFRGGQEAAGNVGEVLQAVSIGAGLGNSSLTAPDPQKQKLLGSANVTEQAVKGRKKTSLRGVIGGALETAENGVLGAGFGFRNREGLVHGTMGGKGKKGNTFFQSLMTTATQVADSKEKGGVLGLAKEKAANSGVGKYLGGVKTAAGGITKTPVGSKVLNGLKGAGGITKEILSGIVGAQDLGMLPEDASLIKGTFSNIKGAAAGKIGALASSVSQSSAGRAAGSLFSKVGPAASGAAGGLIGKIAPIAGGAAGAVAGAAGSAGSVAGAGAGLLGSIWSPVAGGLGGLAAGAAPVIAAISGVIAVVSILGDNLEGIRGIIQSVFGDQGVQVFDAFTGKISQIGDFISGLFTDGGVAAAFGQLQGLITNVFGESAGNLFGDLLNTDAFQGVITILQSIMGVVGQLVSFATTTVKPIIQDIFTFITGTVLPGILQMFSAAAPTIANIISGLGSALMTGMQIAGMAIQAILPIVQNIITIFMNVASVVIPAVLSGFQTFSAGISSIMTSVQGIFSGLIDFITGVFTGNWSQAWEGVKAIFSNAFDALVTLCKTPINAVIGIINKAIGGINSILGKVTTIPEWVPVVGGKSFSMQLPTIPQLARGGFTNGVSIAGEAGTEAVISFQRSVRGDNIATWLKAGKMLGMGNMLTGGQKPLELAAIGEGQAKTVELKPIDAGTYPKAESKGSRGEEKLVFAPQFIIQGNADRSVLEEAAGNMRELFEKWYAEMQRRKKRLAY